MPISWEVGGYAIWKNLRVLQADISIQCAGKRPSRMIPAQVHFLHDVPVSGRFVEAVRILLPTCQCRRCPPGTERGAVAAVLDDLLGFVVYVLGQVGRRACTGFGSRPERCVAGSLEPSDRGWWSRGCCAACARGRGIGTGRRRRRRCSARRPTSSTSRRPATCSHACAVLPGMYVGVYNWHSPPEEKSMPSSPMSQHLALPVLTVVTRGRPQGVVTPLGVELRRH